MPLDTASLAIPTPGVSSSPRFVRLLIVLINGAILAYYVMTKIHQGDITGPIPANKSEREAWYRLKKRPWAIRFGGTKNEKGEKVGGTWIEYRRMEPYNTVIAATYMAYDKIKNAKDDDTRAEIFLEIANGMKNNVIDGSYFQGLQAAMNRHQKARGAVARFGASWVPYSSFWRSMSKAYEVYDEGAAKPREANEWIRAFSQTVPGLSGKLPAKLDMWGEESVIPGGVFRQWLPFKWAKETDDPVEKELERLEVYPGRPKQTITRNKEKVELSLEDYQKYAIDLGTKAKSRISKEIKSRGYNYRTDEQKSKILKKIFHKERSAALRRLNHQLSLRKLKKKPKNPKLNQTITGRSP